MIVTPLFASFTSGLLGFAMLILSLFLILLILVQRGRGGGLTGALGGPGGQSAFGTKAGDLFTRITSFVALGWITLCAFTMWLLGPSTASVAVSPTPAVSADPASTPASSDDLIDLGGLTGGVGATMPPAASTTDVELTPAATPPPPSESPATPPISEESAAVTSPVDAPPASASPTEVKAE